MNTRVAPLGLLGLQTGPEETLLVKSKMRGQEEDLMSSIPLGSRHQLSW
jgi:hypothetical protein